MEVLSLQNIKKHYDGQEVLHIDSLSLSKGDIHGYLGRNGAGKSTTIKIIMGIIAADQGKVYFQGKPIDFNDVEFKQFIGYCPDYPAVFENLTVQEHLQFLGYLYNMKNNIASNDKINQLLQLYEMEKHRHTLIKNLSRGNKQKVAIIASVLHNPLLLIYDEPTLGLDPLSIRQFKVMLKEFTEEGGTVFLSSHLLSVIEEIADTVSIINNGTIIRKNISTHEIRSTLTSIEDYLITAVEEEN